MSPPVLELSGVSKDYHALRPLRLQHLSIEPGGHVAILGVDEHAAEMLINLVTGAVLPDQGEVRVHGRATSDVTDSTDWLAVVDRFGIVSERAVLLHALSVLQNLAIPFSLDIDPLADDLRDRAIALARETGLNGDDWERRVGELGSAARLRVRLGRALALDPAIVVLEHPSAALARAEVVAMGLEIRGILERRRLSDGPPTASLTLTADLDFAQAVATRVLSLDPASGRLTEKGRRRWFGRGMASLVEWLRYASGLRHFG